jgi:hypothetical protein
MGNLIEYFTGDDNPSQSRLTEMKLGREPAMGLFFTADTEDVRLHYVDDESVRSYVRCPGTGCPLCYCGIEPQSFKLLPTYDVEAGDVKVLRISTRRSPDSLGPLLVPHLRDPDVASKLILLRRDGPKYGVEVRKLGPNAKRGESAIREFLELRGEGLQLQSAFELMSPVELSEVPKVAAKLEAIGGWEQPANDEPEGDTATTDGEESKDGADL